MAKSLSDFLEELDSNANLKAEYEKDPAGTAKNAGLSDEDVSIIKNKDWDSVKKMYENLGTDPKIHDAH